MVQLSAPVRVLVVVAEIAFLGRLDLGKNAALVDSMADLFHRSPPSEESAAEELELPFDVGRNDQSLEMEENGTYEDWLEREDRVVYSRDFKKVPVLVSGFDEEWKTCGVGCRFAYNSDKKLDAGFLVIQSDGAASVHRSMESALYYPENNIVQARRWEGF